jgi:hypothetical protein
MTWEEQVITIAFKKKLVLSQVSIYDVLEMYGVERSHDKVVCPFPDHNDDNPSLIVYGETNSFHCFGCNKGWNVIDFVMYMDGCDFVSAVKKLMPMRKEGVNFSRAYAANIKESYAFDIFCRLRDFLKSVRGYSAYDAERSRTEKIFRKLDNKLSHIKADDEERLQRLGKSMRAYIDRRTKELVETLDGYGRIRL